MNDNTMPRCEETLPTSSDLISRAAVVKMLEAERAKAWTAHDRNIGKDYQLTMQYSGRALMCTDLITIIEEMKS